MIDRETFIDYRKTNNLVAIAYDYYLIHMPEDKERISFESFNLIFNSNYNSLFDLEKILSYYEIKYTIIYTIINSINIGIQ